MSTTDAAEELAQALETVRGDPENLNAWSELEELAGAAQRFEEVAKLYQDVLSTELSRTARDDLGERAVAFVEEWYGEDAPELLDILNRLFDLNPTSSWAFQRLTVVHTAAARWDELFRLYDRALDAATGDRRQALLDEASNVALEFADDAGRAIGYLQQLLPLVPADDQLAATYERLLEGEQRWADLIQLWAEQLTRAPSEDEAFRLRKRTAETYLDQLGEPELALREIRSLVDSESHGEEATALVERLGESEEVSAEVRREALSLLTGLYQRAGREDDVLRVLRLALELSTESEKASLHSKIGHALFASGELAPAHEHFAEVIKLDGAARDALSKLRDIASQTAGHERFAQALEESVQSHGVDVRVARRMEAANVRRRELSDLDGAIALYQAVVGEPDLEGPTALDAARRLADLLGKAGRSEEQLPALEQLANAEPEALDRRAVLGRAAQLAEALGEAERAIALWRRCLDADAGDSDALNALIRLLEQQQEWEALIEALRLRIGKTSAPHQRRDDLARIARVEEHQLEAPDRAIASWKQLMAEHGEDVHSVQALASLLEQVGAHQELGELLSRAASDNADAVATLYANSGRTRAQFLSDSGAAVDAFEQALRIDPSHEAARQGITELLDDEACLPRTSVALAKAYQATDEWEKLVGLLEYRLSGAPDVATQVRILRETGQLLEQRGNDLESALACIRRAMALAPELRDIEADVFRLAETTGRWDVAVTAIREAIEALGPETPRARYLRFWEAKLCESELDQIEDALNGYWFVFDAARGREDAASGVMRCGAQLGNYDAMAACLLTISQTKGAPPAAVVDAATHALAKHHGFDAFCQSFEGALSAADLLEADLARQLEVLLASLHREQRGDVAACEAALSRAVAREPSHEETLRELAELQRQAPSEALYRTLRSLAAVASEPLPVLREAAEVRLAIGDDGAEQRAVVQRLYDEATRVWRNVDDVPEEVGASARWALEHLLSMLDETAEAKAKMALLIDMSQLPMDAGEARELRRRAAEIAVAAGDNARAMALFGGILDEVPDDMEVLRALADVCEREGRLAEMAALRQRELRVTDRQDRRLTLRLDLARIVGEIERQGGRVESLLENLKEVPGHEASIDALFEVLVASGRFRDLTNILSEQAVLLEERGEPAGAASLHAKVAGLAEVQLEDVDRAIAAHQRVVDLEPDALDSLDALARLHLGREEFAQAAPWLERRLAKAREPSERAELALSLARALYGAGRDSRGDAILERALEQSPERFDLRERLSARYREIGESERLARLLTDAAPYLEDPEQVQTYAKEAAELWATLERPEEALPVLERAATEAPEERGLRLRYCVALRRAGRHEDAEQALTSLIESYGRRKNTERAAVHFELAEVYRAVGKAEQALEELEQAAKMDMQNPTIKLVLGQVAQEAGDHDRAERAYRALLLLVRRQGDDAPASVANAQVLFHLAEIAAARGDDKRAEEQLSKAVDAAIGSDSEARRLFEVACVAGRYELALSVLDQRLEHTKAGSEAHFRLCLDAGMLLSDKLGREDEGISKILEALSARPWVQAEVEAARPVIKRAGAARELVKHLASRVQTLKDPADQTELLLLQGSILEADLDEPAEARRAYEQAEQTSRNKADAWKALSRIASKTGDTAEELRTLQLLVSSGDSEASAAADAMYRVAELTFQSDREGGVEKLQLALAQEPRPTLAGELLRRATNEALSDPSMDLYQSVARSSGDPELLLDYLEKRLESGESRPGEHREGAELALHQGDPARARKFLELAIEQANASPEGLAAALWAPLGLAAVAEQEGNIQEALNWFDQAASMSDPDPAVEIRLRAAAMSAGHEEHLDLAVETYGRLFEEHPGDPRVWKPFLELARRSGDEDRFTDVSAQILDGTVNAEARAAVRIERAQFLLERPGREPDAADELRAVLDEEPGHEAAAQLLANLFERTGYDDALADLLAEQLDVAIDKHELDTVKDLSLRLGELVGRVRRADALDVYRKALNWLPEDRDVAEALLGLLDSDDDLTERIEVSERLLATDTPEMAAARALSLADDWQRLGDAAAARRVLEAGYRSAPANEMLRERLEAHYRDGELWQELAEFWVSRAAEQQGEMATELLQKSAELFSETLNMPNRAAEVLREALERAPGNRQLLMSLIRQRAAAGEQEAAIQDITAALEVELPASEQGTMPGEERAELISLRASLYAGSGNHDQAIADLEEAYALGGERFAAPLTDALEARLRETDDEATLRATTLRLVALARESNDEARARDVLRGWIDRSPHDREALTTLRQMDEASERFEDLGNTLSRLVELENGDAQVEVALALVDAYAKAGLPALSREALEAVHRAQPEVAPLREKLMQLYEGLEAHAELAGMLLQGLNGTTDEDERYRVLRTAGDHFLRAGDAESATGPLQQAHDMRGDDHDATVLLVDCYVEAQRYPEAGQLLETAIANHPRRRSPELAQLKQRMARLARVSANDRVLEMQWLSDALESDKNNGEIAATLAELAMELQEWEVADRTLRIVAMNKNEGPMSRAMAFLLQAKIARERGEERRALLLARKARSEDPALDAAQDFLREIAEK